VVKPLDLDQLFALIARLCGHDDPTVARSDGPAICSRPGRKAAGRVTPET
jgi:hypothetical protein